MQIDNFKVEEWLNPLDPIAKYNLGSSCCKPVTLEELLELTNTDPEVFFENLKKMSLHYGYFMGMPRLKEAISGLYTDVVTPEMVLCVHGGTGANSIVCYVLCEPGDNIVSILPNYQQFYSIPESMGIETRRYTCDAASGYGIDMAQIRSMVDEKTKMINLASPNNPTGYALSKSELEELADIARSVGAYVAVDEIYRGLSDEYMYSIVDVYEKGICTSSTSKVFSSAGTRVGWIVTRDLALKDAFMSWRSYNSICEGEFNETIASIVLENADVFYQRNTATVRKAQAELKKWLVNNPHFHVACESQSSTSLLYYDFDIPAAEFAKELFDAKSCLVCHGMCFEEEHSFRIGYGFGDLDYFKAGLEQISDFVKELEESGQIPRATAASL